MWHASIPTDALLQSAQFWPIRTRTRTHDVFIFSYIICRFSSNSPEPSRYHLNTKLFRFEDQVGSRRTRRRRRDGSSSRSTVRRFALCRCPRRGAFDHQSGHELVTTHATGVRVAYSHHGTWSCGWSVDRCALIASWYVSALCIRVPVLLRTSLLLPGHARRAPQCLPVYSVAPGAGRTPSIDQR